MQWFITRFADEHPGAFQKRRYEEEKAVFGRYPQALRDTTTMNNGTIYYLKNGSAVAYIAFS